MDNFIYIKALENDIDFISNIRLEVLRTANNLIDDINMDNIYAKTYEYYGNTNISGLSNKFSHMK